MNGILKSQVKKAAVRGAASLKLRPNFNTSIVHTFKGAALTDSLAISHEFGRTHSNVLKSLDDLIKDGTLSRVDFKLASYLDEQGKSRRMIELTEDGALISMPFIGGKKSRQGQVILVRAFRGLRIELASNEPWIETRKAASIGYGIMSEALHDVRAEQCKDTTSIHHMREAKLTNFVVFGEFKGVDRDRASSKNLAILVKVEMKNAHFLSIGKDYAFRKAILIEYVAKLKAKALPRLAGAA